jgi:hypothetical protein
VHGATTRSLLEWKNIKDTTTLNVNHATADQFVATADQFVSNTRKEKVKERNHLAMIEILN